MVELPLGLSPGEGVHAVEGGQIAIFVGHVQSLVSRFGQSETRRTVAFGDADRRKLKMGQARNRPY
jgi:hypothetical protein